LLSLQELRAKFTIKVDQTLIDFALDGALSTPPRPPLSDDQQAIELITDMAGYMKVSWMSAR
jgi:hypothetical protein